MKLHKDQKYKLAAISVQFCFKCVWNLHDTKTNVAQIAVGLNLGFGHLELEWDRCCFRMHNKTAWKLPISTGPYTHTTYWFWISNNIMLILILTNKVFLQAFLTYLMHHLAFESLLSVCHFYAVMLALFKTVILAAVLCPVQSWYVEYFYPCSVQYVL